MYLATDEQTIDDLGIFSRNSGSSIYELYDRTNTRGGADVLKRMFMNPLSDWNEINRRSNIIADFAVARISFPFEAALFDTAEKYMVNAPGKSNNLSSQANLSEKEIQGGVAAVITLVRRLKDFVEMAAVTAIAAYAAERQQIVALVQDPVFEPVFKETSGGKISYTAAAAYDLLFRLREQEKIRELMRYVYQLDVYLSIAQMATERKFVFPKAYEKGKGQLRLEGVYHPELKQPVHNDVYFDAQQNVLFLTGANMAGKSTFLRAVSTAVYIAHVGFPVAAKQMDFSVLDGMYTTINLPDNLGMGASHFYNEVLRVKKVATELHQGRSLFVVFDELFRGTNVKDAHEATIEVTAAFARKVNSWFIISSHIVEAGAQLKTQPTVMFRYLPTRMKGHVPEYTYTLEEGITEDRHGMIIIRNEGILDILKNGRGRKQKKKEQQGPTGVK